MTPEERADIEEMANMIAIADEAYMDDGRFLRLTMPKNYVKHYWRLLNERGTIL